MCGGPSQTQLDLQSEEANFLKTQINAYSTAYSNFKGIQDALNAQFAPILAAGPGARGFSDAERNDLNTQATEGTAQGYAKAARALQENIATQGGGTSNINQTGGVAQQQKEQLASTAEGVMSAEKLGITQADYASGFSLWQNAVQGEENLAAGWNPNSFSGSVNSSAQTANSEANTITQQQNAIWGSVMGALGGIAANAGGKNWSL